MAADATTGERDPRVLLAIERTFLAWTRTALALMGFGFIVARLGLMMRELAAAGTAPPPPPGSTVGSMWLGAALVVLGIVVQGTAIREYWYLLARFQRGDTIADPGWPVATLLGTALIVIGVGLAIYILRVTR